MDLGAGTTESGNRTFLFILIIRSKIQIMSVVKKDVGNISRNFVICDTQEEYSENLLKVLTEKISEDYQFYLFRNIGKLKEFLETNDAEILLVGEEYPSHERKTISVGKRFLLTGSPCGLQTEESAASNGDDVFLFRYQAADRMIRIIFGGREHTEAEAETKKKSGVRIRDAPDLKGIIGIYSPVHRVGKTNFAIKLGKQLARKREVLYLNMEGYSGGSYYFPDSPAKNLGDLVYYIKQETGDPGIRISSMAGQTGGMDYIMPMENEKDLREVKSEEWMLLLDTILENCIYEVIILDLGDCITGLYDILRRCDRVYTHYLEEGAAEAKIRQYEENLRVLGYGDILQKTVKKRAGKAKNAEERSESPG